MSDSYEDKTDGKRKKRDRIINHGAIARFGKRLKLAMDGISNAELARRSGMSETTIRKYLQGKIYPALDSLAVVADACGVSIAWLATGEPAQPLSPEAGIQSEHEQKFDIETETLRRLFRSLKKEERDLVIDFIYREGVNNLVRLAAMKSSTVTPEAIESIIDALPIRPMLKNVIKIGLAGSEATDREILRVIERQKSSGED